MSTLSKIYIHVVFSVRRREKLIDEIWEEELYKFIAGLVQNKEQKMIAINGTADHIHMLLGIKPACCLSELVREIKKSTDELIKNRRLSKYEFSWQTGFAAFSCSDSQLDNLVKYILNQKEHHRVKTFTEEYVEFLKSNNVEFKPEYLFENE
jgi:putative transposase